MNRERMNNDPGAAGREGAIVLWLWQVSQQTFWTFLDLASEVLSGSEGGGEVHAAGTCGGFEEGVLERVMNAGGMLLECRMGLFRGGLLNEGRCGLEGNHRIIIPPLLTFFCPTHTHTDPHTHIPVEHSPLYDHQGGKV